ncbi:MAG: hypothetical protein M3O36_02575, partial [Myxococcota bacterium]|nr:hypothetical protein [Myxococcota bacterium]
MDKKRLLAVAGIGVLWSCAAGMVGCSSDDTTAQATDSGTSDATTAKEGGSSGGDSSTRDVSVADVVVNADVTTPVPEAGADAADAGTDAVGEAAVSTLYTRLGGHAGIRAAVNAIVAQELKDPEIVSYFYAQLSSPVPATAPTAEEIEECLTDQLGAAAGGPETYPNTVSTIVVDGGVVTVTGADAGTLTDAGHATWLCRDMMATHAHLHISSGTFDRFVSIAAAELTLLNVSPADITTIGTVLAGTKTAIVDPALADAGPLCFPGPLPDGGAPTCAVPEGGADAG